MNLPDTPTPSALPPAEPQTKASELGRPIFVVGYMHSGTTLLLRVLGKHPDVFTGCGETKFFERLPSIRSRFPNIDNLQATAEFLQYVANIIKIGYNPVHRNDPRAQIPAFSESELPSIFDTARGETDHRQIFRIACEQLTLQAGKSRCLEKTPTHIFHVEDIVACMPDAQFVQIVRDARDILASKKTRRATVWNSDRYSPKQRPLKHLEKAYHPMWGALAWKSAIQAGRLAAQNYPGQVHTVRYEDLVANPESTLRDCCRFLDVKFYPEMLRVGSLNPADHHQNSNTASISRASVGRWHNVLKPAETAVCQRVAGKELTSLGYTLQRYGWRTWTLSNRYFLSGIGELLQRLYRRWRQGGLRYLLNVLTNYRNRVRTLRTSRS